MADTNFTSRLAQADDSLTRKINDASDNAGSAITKLNALLSVITGDGYESFSRVDEDLQHAYLWACADLASQANHELVLMGLLRTAARAA